MVDIKCSSLPPVEPAGHALLPKDTTQFGTAQDCEQVGQPREKFKRLSLED
jgi:hypothetical protein